MFIGGRRIVVWSVDETRPKEVKQDDARRSFWRYSHLCGCRRDLHPGCCRPVDQGVAQRWSMMTPIPPTGALSGMLGEAPVGGVRICFTLTELL